MLGVIPLVYWTAPMAGQEYSGCQDCFIDLSVQIRPQGGQLQPPGCDECSDVEEGIQGRGRPATEDAAQYPPQG